MLTALTILLAAATSPAPSADAPRAKVRAVIGAQATIVSAATISFKAEADDAKHLQKQDRQIRRQANQIFIEFH